MGVDLTTYIRHNFDVQSMDKLAEDLAKRLNATVVYGYYKDWDDSTDGVYFEKDPDKPNTYYAKELFYDFYDYYFIIKGYAGENEGKVYHLIMEGYFLSLLQPTHPPVICYDFFECYPGTFESFHLSIFRECFYSSVSWIGRAHGFFSCFTGFTDHPEWEKTRFDEFRKEIDAEQKLLGVSGPAFYACDSSSNSLLADPAEETWVDLLEKLHQEAGEKRVIDLGDWFRAGAILEKQTPFAVIDDFSYWP